MVEVLESILCSKVVGDVGLWFVKVKLLIDKSFLIFICKQHSCPCTSTRSNYKYHQFVQSEGCSPRQKNTYTMDAFDARLQFTSKLSKLSASTQAARSCAQFALKHKEYHEDLHSCILEQLATVCFDHSFNT